MDSRPPFQASYVEQLARIALWGLVACAAFDLIPAVFWLTTGQMLWPDSTDSDTERSGLQLRVDHGTGCQYLVSSGGSLTPRLTKDGKPICGGAP